MLSDLLTRVSRICIPVIRGGGGGGFRGVGKEKMKCRLV